MRNSIDFLIKKAYELKKLSLIQTGAAQSGHPTSCLSAAEICTALFFEIMQFDPDNYHDVNSDRFILSKGHAAPLLYAVWHELGKVSYEQLITYRSFSSPLEGHPTFRFAYTEAATGSLGIGLSIGVGQAWIRQRENNPFSIYVLLGDGEMSEGSNWEAIMRAGELGLSNLTAIIDCNGLSQSESSIFSRSDYKTLINGFKSFEWETEEVNGHNMEELINSLKKVTTGKPKAIIAHTHKGHGVSFLADKEGYHGKALTGIELEKALDELEVYQKSLDNKQKNWNPPIKKIIAIKNSPHAQLEPRSKKELELLFISPISTRKAAGISLTLAGNHNEAIVCLDADVKNSTYTDIFEKYFKERFFQCFIAEQNMIGVALGLERQGKKPFAATFASFLTRAHDQIRMAAIGNSKIKIIGSHAGISIGKDGPSQMGLEDIALFASIPNALILYPCDGISTLKLFSIFEAYDDGIGYMRTTRQETPILYKSNDTFKLGGSCTLRSSDNDQICIVTAGITVFEALKAHELLAQENIFISIIDAYCLKPFDEQNIILMGKKANNRILTVEDHYQAGGIGQIISGVCSQNKISVYSLTVQSIPRSGSSQNLLSWAQIDANGIITYVKKLLMRLKKDS